MLFYYLLFPNEYQLQWCFFSIYLNLILITFSNHTIGESNFRHTHTRVSIYYLFIYFNISLGPAPQPLSEVVMVGPTPLLLATALCLLAEKDLNVKSFLKKLYLIEFSHTHHHILEILRAKIY